MTAREDIIEVDIFQHHDNDEDYEVVLFVFAFAVASLG